MKRVITACMALLVVCSAYSNEESEQGAVATSKLHLAVELGVGVMTNPLTGGDNLPLVVVPDIAYYTDTWYFDNAQFGYTFDLSPRHALSAIAEFNPETRFFVDWHPANVFAFGSAQTLSASEVDTPRVRVDEVESRKWAFDAGLQYNYFLEQGQLIAKVLGDISDVYRGWRADLAWQKRFQYGELSVQPTLGVSYANAEMNDYFYGLSIDEAPELGGVSIGSSLAPYVKIDVGYKVSPNNHLHFHLGYFEYQQQARSPLFEESYSLSAFIGIKHII